MSRSTAFAALGTLMLAASGGPALAGDVAISFGFGAPSARPVYDYSYGDSYGYRAARFYDDRAFHAPRHYERVFVRRFVDNDEEECRVIVKRRYNRFGELVVKRIRVCD